MDGVCRGVVEGVCRGVVEGVYGGWWMVYVGGSGGCM